MNAVTTNTLQRVLGESMVDVRQAALMFNLPAYWLSQAKERRQRCIPYYSVGKLVRFKPHELHAWVLGQQAQPFSEQEGADA